MRPYSVGTNLTANTATTLFTVPTGYYALCVLLHASNNGSSNKHISFTWHDFSANLDIPITKEYTLTSKNTYAEIDVNQYIVLEEGDYISALSETGSTISVIATFEIEGSQRI
jgi:hypothetical protein